MVVGEARDAHAGKRHGPVHQEAGERKFVAGSFRAVVVVVVVLGPVAALLLIVRQDTGERHNSAVAESFLTVFLVLVRVVSVRVGIVDVMVADAVDMVTSHIQPLP